MSAFYATNKEVKILSNKLDLLSNKLDLLNTVSVVREYLANTRLTSLTGRYFGASEAELDKVRSLDVSTFASKSVLVRNNHSAPIGVTIRTYAEADEGWDSEKIIDEVCTNARIEPGKYFQFDSGVYERLGGNYKGVIIRVARIGGGSGFIDGSFDVVILGSPFTQISKNVESLTGLLANRPAPDAAGVIPGTTTYTAPDDGWIYVSDGTQWRKWLEVGKWT